MRECFKFDERRTKDLERHLSGFMRTVLKAAGGTDLPDPFNVRSSSGGKCSEDCIKHGVACRKSYNASDGCLVAGFDEGYTLFRRGSRCSSFRIHTSLTRRLLFQDPTLVYLLVFGSNLRRNVRGRLATQALSSMPCRLKRRGLKRVK